MTLSTGCFSFILLRLGDLLIVARWSLSEICCPAALLYKALTGLSTGSPFLGGDLLTIEGLSLLGRFIVATFDIWSFGCFLMVTCAALKLSRFFGLVCGDFV